MYLLALFTAICCYTWYTSSLLLSYVCILMAGVCIGVWISSFDRIYAIIHLFTKWKSKKVTTKRGIETLYDDNIILNLALPSTSWFNMGYWAEAQGDFVRACEAMTRLVADAVCLTSSDTVLDVGCGSGEQDFYISEAYKCKIIAIDISTQQIVLANKKLEQQPERWSNLKFSVGSATNLEGYISSQDAGSEEELFDKVLSLDSAYHYRLRVDFFDQAFKVLKPGGLLGLADICLSDTANLTETRMEMQYVVKILVEGGYVPYANLYPRGEYTTKLEQAGFVDVNIKVITDHVFPGLLHFLETQKARMREVARSHHWLKMDAFAYMLGMCVKRKWIEFIVVHAKKPQGNK